MSQANDAAKKAAEDKKKAEDEAKAKAAAEKAKKPTQVRVICKGTLGHLLLKKGDVTDDPEYVELLDSKRGRTLVEKVISRGDNLLPETE